MSGSSRSRLAQVSALTWASLAGSIALCGIAYATPSVKYDPASYFIAGTNAGFALSSAIREYARRDDVAG